MKCTIYRKDGRFVCYDDVVSIHTDYINFLGGTYIKIKYHKTKHRFDALFNLSDIYPSYEIDRIVMGGGNE